MYSSIAANKQLNEPAHDSAATTIPPEQYKLLQKAVEIFSLSGHRLLYSKLPMDKPFRQPELKADLPRI